MANTRLIGKKAEDLAVHYLKRNGYRIIQRNYANKIGEIDIVGFENGQLVFIEVKARKTALFGLPMESINTRKQNKLRLVAQSYIKQYGMPKGGCRFDVISIILNKSQPDIQLIKNAF
ncbi:MAG TPA: YraN family protein [Clostridia bacterium]|jgi:putative endonuclease|nr:YraN family protein [Clostridia bacterium]